MFLVLTKDMLGNQFGHAEFPWRHGQNIFSALVKIKGAARAARATRAARAARGQADMFKTTCSKHMSKRTCHVKIFLASFLDINNGGRRGG